MECDSDLPSTQLYEMLSLTHMPRSLVLLMPTNLLPNAYLLAIHAPTYGANGGYLIYEEDALIYESPSPPLPAIDYSNSAYQTLYAGSVPVFVTHTSDGNNPLEWY